MSLTKVEADGINLADTFAFTGTVSGAGGYTKTAQTTTSGAATYSISSIPSGTSELILFGNQVDRGTSTSTAVILVVWKIRDTIIV